MLITSSANRSSAGAAIGGVGLLLSPSAYDSLASMRSHSDRILVANFQGNPATTVITTYCPTNVVNEDIIEGHYNNLRRAIDSIPAHNVLLVVGDFNARIGPEDAKYTYHETTNRNGKYLVDMAVEKNLVIASGQYCKKKGKLWTYISPGGSKCQLDYILIRKKWRNSLNNVEAYSIFASVGSDHRIVSARVRLSLRKSKTLAKGKQHDWKLLSTDNHLQKLYSIEVRNRFQPLEKEEESATERYERFITAHKEATEKVIPVKKKTRKLHFPNDTRVISARNKINKAYMEYQKDTSDENRQIYKQAKHNLEEAYSVVIEEDLDSKLKDVERAHANSKHGQSWRLINDITGRKASPKGQLKGDTQKDRVINWFNQFKNLLGSPPDIDDEDEEILPILESLNIKTGPFDLKEYSKAIKSLVEGKSFGEDGIPPEVLKRCDLDEIILSFCNNALINEEKPHQWSILNIVPIPKSGDLSQGGNYRGISLSSIVAKTFNRLILNRIRPVLDSHLRTNQNGFRVGRTTVGHILALRRLIEGVKENQLPAIITFIDFRKAFDTIHRGKMLKILTAYGIPEQLVNAIGKMYEDTKAKVISPDGETDLFEIMAGVLQGDTLAPYLFVIVLDYALRAAIDGHEEELGFQLERRRSRRVGPEIITDLDFADDIALLSEELEQAQKLLSRVETSVGKVGLRMNSGKTKFMSFNHRGIITIKTNDETQLENVPDFKYLGALMVSTEKDVKARKSAAWRACSKLGRIWKSSLPRQFKQRLFVATVESVLLYGCEAWAVTTKLAKELDGCYTRLLRTAFNVHWSQHITNKELYGNLPKVSEKIRERRLRFAGHSCRNINEPISQLLLWKPKHGKKKPGRPHLTYTDLLKKDTGLELSEIKAAMLDRNVWMAITARAVDPT
ncbi:uncharacterized protein LOC115923289 [Strongylocentrotus purpuratus]|uniref:Reverse transcriptase domain-containing protein n=1 Tax=Strongylocentrotus purpuratus TaxID=7668 RepID=A0A7M7NPI9_STRPU|nr:uncharacterized protein LOC115923289 [Strongylocentrotus purpuratus]